MNGDQSKTITGYLKWNFTTDETVLLIVWYKDDLLIAELAKGELVATDDYSGRVSLYTDSEHNAAIQLNDLNESDSGTYTCIVSTSFQHSQTGIVKIISKWSNFCHSLTYRHINNIIARCYRKVVEVLLLPTVHQRFVS